MGSSQAPHECNFNYGATKAAVDQLTKAFARELGPHGINVNSIAPGSIETDQSFVKRRGAEAERHAAERAKLAVLGRRGKPDDVANLALFLATDASSFITGQTILADGGRTDYML
jgi:NAD(P)-dependent dehydrogenase (short-subunit alcohol dehydrogenase family)